MIERLRALLCGCGVALAVFSGLATGLPWAAWCALGAVFVAACVRRPLAPLHVGTFLAGIALGVALAPDAWLSIGSEWTIAIGGTVALSGCALPGTQATDFSPRSLAFTSCAATAAAAATLSARDVTTITLQLSGYNASVAATALVTLASITAISAALTRFVANRHPKLMRASLVVLPIIAVVAIHFVPVDSARMDDVEELTDKLHTTDASRADFLGSVALFVLMTGGVAAAAFGATLGAALATACRWSGLAIPALLLGGSVGIALQNVYASVVAATIVAPAAFALLPLVIRRRPLMLLALPAAVAIGSYATAPRCWVHAGGSASLRSPLGNPQMFRAWVATNFAHEKRHAIDLEFVDRVELAMLSRFDSANFVYFARGYLPDEDPHSYHGPPLFRFNLAVSLPAASGLDSGSRTPRWERLLLEGERDRGCLWQPLTAQNLRFILRNSRAPSAFVDAPTPEFDQRFRLDLTAAIDDADISMERRLWRAAPSVVSERLERFRARRSSAIWSDLIKLWRRREWDYDDASIRHAFGTVLLADRHGQRALAGINEIARSFELRLVNFDAFVDRDAALLFAAARGLRKWSQWGPLDANVEVRKSAARLSEIDDPLLRARELRVIATAERADPSAHRSAAAHLAEARALDPYDTNVIRELARLALADGDVAAARAAADDAVALDPLEPESHLLAARAAANVEERRASVARYLRLSGAALDLSSSAPAR